MQLPGANGGSCQQVATSGSSSGGDSRRLQQQQQQQQQQRCWVAECSKRLWLRAYPLGFKDEFLAMLSLSWPAMLTTFFQFFLQTVSIVMCGQLSKTHLDGVSLAGSFINVAGICVGVGMSTACDTLFSQTYGSANKKRVGMYVQRSLMVMYTALALLYCLHLNIEPLLLWLGQQPDIASIAADFMLHFMPGLFFDFSFLVLCRYLQNQNIMYPPMVAGFVANVFNLVSQYVALHVLGMGHVASALLQSASMAVMFTATLGYTLASRAHAATWDGWQLEALYDWWDFVKLAVPGIFLIALEEWSFEVATVVAGTLGSVQLGAQSILFQLESLAYIIPFGMSVAVNIRVGQRLGAGHAPGAAQSYRVGLLMVVVTSLGMGIMFVLARNQLPWLFTQDSEIASAAAGIIPILGIFQLADSLSATSCGAIRGCGRQLQGALLLFVGYYLLGLPIGIPLALLTDLQVFGMWLGLVVGMVVEALAFCWLVLRLNWQREVRRARRRAYGRCDDSPEAAKAAPDYSGGSECPSDVASERGALLSGSYQQQVTFYSHPGCGSDSQLHDGRAARRRLARNARLLCSGRFYTRSVSLLAPGDEESDSGASELPPLRPVLAWRLATLALVAAALCGSVLLRLRTQAARAPTQGNATAVTNATAVGAL